MLSIEEEIMKLVEEKGLICISDVAEALQISKQTAKAYLFKLCGESKLKFRKMGNMFIFEKNK